MKCMLLSAWNQIIKRNKHTVYMSHHFSVQYFLKYLIQYPIYTVYTHTHTEQNRTVLTLLYIMSGKLPVHDVRWYEWCPAADGECRWTTHLEETRLKNTLLLSNHSWAACREWKGFPLPELRSPCLECKQAAAACCGIMRHLSYNGMLMSYKVTLMCLSATTFDFSFQIWCNFRKWKVFDATTRSGTTPRRYFSRPFIMREAVNPTEPCCYQCPGGSIKYDKADCTLKPTHTI